MGSKLTTMSHAASVIPDGAHITLSGFAHSLAPMAFVRELLRQGKRELELTSMGECWAAEFLCAAERVRKIRLSNYMFEGYGRCHAFSRAVETGKVKVDDYSHYGITARFAAGSLGIPFWPVKVMSGTDIADKKGLPDEIKCLDYVSPFDGEKVLLVPRVQPDFAIIHASRADEEGNVQLLGPRSVIDEQVRAAKKVIVTVEEIVPTETVRKSPHFTIIPGFLVDYLVESPYGAHPAGMVGYYDYDPRHIAQFWIASRSQDTLAEYMKEYIYDCPDHNRYLDKVGLGRLLELRCDPALGYSLSVRGDNGDE